MITGYMPGKNNKTCVHVGIKSRRLRSSIRMGQPNTRLAHLYFGQVPDGNLSATLRRRCRLPQRALLVIAESLDFGVNFKLVSFGIRKVDCTVPSWLVSWWIQNGDALF